MVNEPRPTRMTLSSWHKGERLEITAWKPEPQGERWDWRLDDATSGKSLAFGFETGDQYHVFAILNAILGLGRNFNDEQ